MLEGKDQVDRVNFKAVAAIHLTSKPMAIAAKAKRAEYQSYPHWSPKKRSNKLKTSIKKGTAENSIAIHCIAYRTVIR